MKILHAWDIRIGRGYPEYPILAERLREHRFETLRNLVARAAKERANALILGGNTLADNRITDHEVAELTDLLAASAVPVFILPGPLDPFTPDSPYRLQSGLWEGSVTILGEKQPYPGDGFTLYPFPVTVRDEKAPSFSAAELQEWIPSPRGEQGFRIAVTYRDRQSNGERSVRTAVISSLDYIASSEQTLLPGEPRAEEDTVGARLVTLRRDLAPTINRLTVGRLRQIALKIQLGEIDDLRRSLEELEHPADAILQIELVGALAIDRIEELHQVIDRWRRKVLYLDVRERFSIEAEATLTFSHPLIRATAASLIQLAMVPCDATPETLPSDSEAARWALLQLTKLLRASPHQELSAPWK